MQSQSRATPVHPIPNGLHTHNHPSSYQNTPPRNRQLTCETYRYLTQTPKCIRELAIAIATVAISHRPHPIDPAATNHKTFLLAQRVAVTIPSSLRTQANSKQKSWSLSATDRWPNVPEYLPRPPHCTSYTATCQSANGETQLWSVHVAHVAVKPTAAKHEAQITRGDMEYMLCTCVAKLV